MNTKVIHTLSIEDNLADATLIQEMLAEATQMGWDLPRFEIEHVTRMDAALARLEEGGIDVVLSDLDLPDSRADETVSTLRDRFPRMPVVVLTGREDEALAHKSVRVGVQDYIFKNEATGSLLARTMLYAIERQQAHDRLEQRVEERTAELRQANEELRAEIAERERAEQALAKQTRALQESEKRYRDIVELAPEGIVTVNRRGIVTSCNTAFCELTGFPKDAFVGKHFTKVPTLFAEDILGWIRLFSTILRSGASERIEFRWRHKDGSTRWGELRVGLMREGGKITGLQAMAADITERKQVEEELESQRRLWDALMESTPDLVYFKDHKHRMIRASRTYANVLGMDVEEVVGKTAAELWPEEAEEILADERQVLAGDPLIRKEREVTTPDGESLWYLLTKIPIYQDGDVIGFFAIDKDITERKQVEEQLAFQSMLLDQIQDKVTATDLEGRITYVNEAICRAFGKTADELIGQHVEQYGEDPERGATQQEIIETTRTDGRWRGEVVNITEDGREIVLDSRTQLIYDEDGEPIGMLGISTDITERKDMEKALRESEERFRTIVQLSPIGVGIVDSEGDLIDCNTALAEIVGYSREELLRLNFGDFTHPDDLEREWELINRMWGEETTEYQMEKRYIHKDGHTVWVDVAGSLFKGDEGKLDFGFAFVQDITERKRAERALVEQRDRAQKYLDIVGTIIVALDREGRVELVNRAGCEILGYEEQEIIGENWFDAFLPARVQDQVKGVFRKLMAGETGSPGRVQNRILTREGEERIIQWHNVVLTDDEGNITGTLSSGNDITDRKRAEQEREHYARELERSNRDLQHFAYAISHDLREPLRAVSSYLELLEGRCRGELDEKADKYIDHAVDGAQRMQEMIDALLDLSRVGTRGREFAPTDVEDVLERTLKALERAIQENDAEVTRDSLPTVMADEAQLAQVLQNLIANAVKFHRDEEPPRVHVSAEREDSEWVFSVKDNGVGIDPEQAERLFQVFQRLHTAEEYPGLGIGLALCRRIVERHGGRIWVESEPGEGSIFHFTIPSRREDI